MPGGPQPFSFPRVPSSAKPAGPTSVSAHGASTLLLVDRRTTNLYKTGLLTEPYGKGREVKQRDVYRKLSALMGPCEDTGMGLEY